MTQHKLPDVFSQFGGIAVMHKLKSVPHGSTIRHQGKLFKRDRDTLYKKERKIWKPICSIGLDI